MNTLSRFTLLFLLLLCVNGKTFAQYTTPTVNGSIGTNEYGVHTDGNNQQNNSAGVIWYMTWDATNLYVGISGANVSEAAVLYIDNHPLSPINGGANSDGTNVGFNSYDGTSFAALQFRADIVTYAKNGYREYRTANGSNGWSSQTTSFGSYSDNGQSNSSGVREFSIPWNTINNGGGIPSSFAWFGYVTSSGGFVYGQMPLENGSGTVGTSARFPRYYIINSTTNGSAVKPFGRDSYVFNGTADIPAFSSIGVWDLTMNSSGRTITRATDASTWTIGGNLRVDAGTISFGASTGAASVTGSVVIGGTLALSTAAGGDINVGGDWTNTGTFTNNTRLVNFNGSSAQTVSGTNTFGYVTVNNGAGVTLSGTTTINNTLTLTNGTLTNGANLSMANGSTISRATGTLSAAPTFTTAVNLIYTGSSGVTTGNEFPSTNVLNNLSVSNTGGVTLNTGGTVKGTLTISASSTLADGGFTLTANGNISNAGTHSGSGKISLSGGAASHTLSGTGTYGNLTLNDANNASLSGNTNITGTLTLTTGTFTVGANTITLQNPIGGTATNLSADNTSSITIAGSASGITLPSNISQLNNLTINNSNGTSLPGNISLASLTLTNGTFTVGSADTVFIRSGGSVAATSGSLASSTGAGTFSFLASTAATVTGTVGFYNVAAATGIDFGTASTVNGTLTLNNGGFVNNAHPPIYGTNSTLLYNTGTTYGRFDEWKTTSGAGYPYNVRLGSNTTLDLGNGGTATARQMAGSLTIDNGSTLTMNNGANQMTAALTVTGDAAINGTLTLSGLVGGDINVGGNWILAGTFIPNSRTVRFAGSSAQSLTGATSFAFMTMNNAAGLTLNNNITVSNQLTFTSGTITTGSNSVIMAAGTTVSQTSGYVIGNLQKNVATGATSLTYEVGSPGVYSPVSVAFANVTGSGNLTAAAFAGTHPNIASSGINQSKMVNRYYTLTNSGVTFSTYDATFNFVAGDIAGANTANLGVAKYNSPNWSYPSVGTRTSTSTQATGLSSFSDFAMGELQTFTITSSSDANGSISPSGSTTVTYGGSQSYTLTPNANYHIDSILVDGVYAGNTSPYNFTNVTGNHTISVRYALIGYTLTASAGTNGSIAPNGSVGVSSGGSQSFAISPNTGYHIDSVYVDGVYAQNTSPYNFSNIQSNHTISTSFAVNHYTLTPSAGANGSIAPNTPVDVVYNGSQQFTMTANIGYHIDSIFVDGSYVGNTSPYTISAVAANHSINVTFAVNNYTITPSAGANGSITPGTPQSVAYQGSQIFTVTPNTGYHIDSIFVDGTYIGNTSPDTISNVTANHTFSATFAINTFTITASAGVHGSISPSGAVSVNYNGSQSFTISANSGYHIADVLVDGASVGAVGTYNVTNVTTNRTIAASFVSDTTAAGTVINGTIGAGEYGNQTDGNNQQTSSGTIWYMTWDSTALYVGISSANTGEGAVLYIDKNPLTPINGGTNSDGTIVGQNYDGVSFASLQFRADAVVYFKNGYREIRTANGSNGWSAAIAGFGTYADNGSSVREIAIPWSSITGGSMPSSFAWFGYVASGAGFVFGQVPAENIAGAIGTTARYGRYYIVNSTAIASPVKPFSRNSYVFNQPADDASFGTIGVYDFTMNSSGQKITRSAGAGGGWTISGSLLVNGGTIDFGSSSTSASVAGDVTVGSGGTVILSSAVGGDLNLGGNWTNNGTFTPANRAVGFNGSAPQTSTGSTTFDYLSLNNAAGLSLNNTIAVRQTLTLTNGTVTTGSNKVSVDSTGSVARTNGYINGNLQKTIPSGAVTKSFEVGDASNYTPVSVSFASVTMPGTLLANTSAGDHPQVSSSGLTSSKTVNRYWTLTNTGTAFTTYNVTFNFVPGDLDAGINSNYFAVKKYDSPNWTSTTVGTRTSTSTQATGMTSFSDFAIGEVPADTITATAGSNGSISPSGAVPVAQGDNQSFTFTPLTNYHIDSVFVDGVYAGNTSPYSFTNVTANHTINVTFAINTYIITASAGANGSISPNGSISVNAGANQSFTISANSGYHIDSLIVDNANTDTASVYQFTNVLAAHSIRTVFAVNPPLFHTITATAGTGGSISPSGSVSVTDDSNKTFTITPGAGYQTDSIIVDGVSQALSGSYTFTHVVTNHTIRTVFKGLTFTIVASAGANGAISPSDTVVVAYDSNKVFTITPNTGYHIDSIVVDGSYAGNSSPDTIKTVTANHTIRATFAVNVYTITPSAGAHGSISPSSPQSVMYDSSQSFTMTPNSGYHIDSVIVDGIFAGRSSPYSFTHVTSTHTISVKFVVDTSAAGVVIDGAIGSGEYGNQTDGQNQQSNSGVVWYMTWDSTALYVGISGAPTTEGAILYIDKNPLSPINGGTNSDGTIAGQNYDNTNFPALQFRADAVTYFKNGYREIRTADGSNGWSGAMLSYGNYADNGSNIREVAIPWSAITGGTIPASFAWFGYLSSSSGFAYGQVPVENASGSIGTSAHFVRYYNVNATTGSTPVKPFARNSYIFTSPTDVTNYGQISVYDFTMNTAGKTISRAAGTGGDWTIAGSLRVDAGTIDFGASTTPATVNGDVTIGNSGTVTLSSAVGGDLNLKGNWSNSGIFDCSNRAVGFVGTTQQSITGAISFDYLSLNNSAGLTLNNDVFAHQMLTLTNGRITTGANKVIIDSTGTVSRTNGYVAGNLEKLIKNGAVSKTFEIGDASNYTPVTVDLSSVTTPGTLTASTTAGDHPQLGTSGLDGSKSVNRYWTLTNNGTVFSTYNAAFTFVPGDLDGGINPNFFAVKKYDAPNWTGTTVGTRTGTSTQATGMTSFSDFAIGQVPTDTIIASAGSNGSIAPTGTVVVVQGDNQSFTLTPASSYHIDSIIVDGAYAGNASPYTFTNVTANHTIRTVFAVNPPNTHQITASAGQHGTIAPNGNVFVVDGNSQVFTITPDTGYHVAGVLVDGSSAGTVTSYNFPNVTTSHTIAATFAINVYTITATTGGHGSISPSGPVTVNYGDSARFTITPSTGYFLDSLVVDGSVKPNAGNYTFFNTTASHTIRVTFKAVQLKIIASAGLHGTIAPTDTVSVAFGTNQVFTLTPATGYHTDSLFVDGVSIIPAPTYTFDSVVANHTIRATFKINSYTITTVVGSNGSIAPPGPVSVTYGGNQMFTITPSGGYQTDSIIVDGIAQTIAPTFTFTNVTANHTIKVKFKIHTNVITASAGPNGTISPSGAVPVGDGGSQLFTFTPATHYRIDSLIVDGALQAVAATYNFTNVTTDHTIRVTFIIDQFMIVASAGANGTIVPSDTVRVFHGDDTTFTFTPDTGYSLDSLIVDGVKISNSPTYTFTSVSASHTIKATFAVNAVYGTKFRTFVYDSLIVAKSIPKKNTTEHWEFRFTNTSGSAITEVNLSFKNDVLSILDSRALTPSVTSTKDHKNWKFNGALSAGDSIVIIGRSKKAMKQTIAKLWFGPVVKTISLKNVIPTVDYPELPLPNAATVREDVYGRTLKASGGLIVGLVRTDSSRYLGWVRMKKPGDMYASLFDKVVLKHTVTGVGFTNFDNDKTFAKEQTSLSPKKQNNKTFADLLTLKFNIVMSQLGTTTPGFGELMYHESGNAFSGKLVRDIATAGDSMMTLASWGTYAGHPELYRQLDTALMHINSAFSGPIDTLSWSDTLKLTGVRRLIDAGMLTPSGIAPSVITSLVADGMKVEMPKTALLYQNYPNPFNPATNIQFDLPNDAVVTLKIYNILGQEVATLIDHGAMFAGNQEAEFSAGNLASGVYFYRLVAEPVADEDGNISGGQFVSVKKMVLVK